MRFEPFIFGQGHFFLWKIQWIILWKIGLFFQFFFHSVFVYLDFFFVYFLDHPLMCGFNMVNDLKNKFEESLIKNNFYLSR